MLNHYLNVIKKYATFEGRASRSEFWYFNLVHALIMAILIGLMVLFVQKDIDGAFIGIIYFFLVAYSLVIFLPQLGVLVRRLHDTGRSGWWYFILLIPVIGIFILLIILCLDSNGGRNKYGQNPKIILIEEEVEDTFNLDIEENAPDSTEIITLKSESNYKSRYILVPEDKSLPTLNIPTIYTDVNTGKITGKSLVIGRKESADVLIENNYLSGKHLEIWAEELMDGPEPVGPWMFFIKDLDSTNGTYLDGEKLIAMEKRGFSYKKRIILGSEEVVYRVKAPGDDE